MSLSHPTRLLLPAATAGLLALAACSSSGTSTGSAGSSPATPTPSASATGHAAGAATTAVKMHMTSLGNVLTDAAGHTLYFSDQEKGHVLCTTASCTAVWVPVTVTGSTAPTGPAGVSLATIARPDGTSQVTLHGQPLYTFAFDHAAGGTDGNGQHDSFGAARFSWHAAIIGAASPQPSMSTSSSGYNY